MIYVYIRSKVVEVLSDVMKRLKVVLSLSSDPDNIEYYSLLIKDLLFLVSSDMPPFASNFSILFLDLILGTAATKQCNTSICCEIIFDKLAQFEIFSNQSNSLCNYCLEMMEYLLKPKTTTISNGGEVLGDFLLDLCLISKGIVKDSLGSIQPGLSEKRVVRIFSRKKNWTKEDLKIVKLAILSNLSYVVLNQDLDVKKRNIISKNILPIKFLVAIAIVLSSDPDSEVSTQAVFKMNGAVHLFSMNSSDYQEEKSIHTDVLIFLFSLVSPSSSRTPLKIELRCTMLRFISKELNKYLFAVSKQVIELVFGNVFQASSNVMMIAACMHLAELFLKNIDNCDSSVRSPSSILLLQCCKKILTDYSTSSLKICSDDNQLSIRTSCYNIIDILARNNYCSVDDTELVVLLFQLLDGEDERVVARLYSALGGLRTVHQSTQTILEIYIYINVIIFTDNVGTGISHLNDRSSLLNLIVGARKSPDPKKRLASVQWSRALFGWQSVTLDTLMALAG